MPDLAAAFREASGSKAGDPVAGLDDRQLEARLGELCARGRAAFPEVAVADELFVRHLGRVVAGDQTGGGSLGDLVIEDLYLACACVQGVPGAVAAFDVRCGPAVRAGLSRLARSPAMQDEIFQALRDQVLVGHAEAPPKIQSYGGKGALPRWVSVTGQRLALMMIRSERVEARARDALAAEAPPPADPEVAFLKQRYRAEFEAVLAEMLKTLSDRERVLLRLNLVQGASAERIGKIYGVSRSTAQRWIQEVRDKIRDGMESLMRERAVLSSAGLGSAARLVASQLDVSLSRLLRTG